MSDLSDKKERQTPLRALASFLVFSATVIYQPLYFFMMAMRSSTLFE